MLPFRATYLADDSFSDDLLTKDEIDNLFEKLKPIEPPPALIQRILDAVTKLPPPASVPPSQDSILPADHLIVRNEDKPAS